MPEILKKSIAAYEAHSPALYRVLVVSIPPVLVLWMVASLKSAPLYFVGVDRPFSTGDYERLLFLTYLIFWAAMWITYFVSGMDIRLFKSQTLRRLLRETSEEWETHRWDDLPFYKEKHSYYDEMSAKTLTASAVMVTASLIVLSQVNATANAAEMSVCSGSLCDHWNAIVIGGAALSGVLAFVGYVISLDLLDSIFIHYRSDALKRRLQHRFFRSMTNRRYPALVALLTAVIFMVAFWEPFLGCLAIAAFFAAGYTNWFPSFGVDARARRNRGLQRLVVILLTLVPVVLWMTLEHK